MLIERLNLEDVLPIAEIRSHCRIDDIPTVTDFLLARYRKAAFEACEQYTGRTWIGERNITQSIAARERDIRKGGRVRIKLEHPPIDGFLTVSDGKNSHTYTVSPGARDCEVPVYHRAEDVSICCNGCDTPVNYGMSVTYRTGQRCAEDIPQGIILGVLKFIAWTVEHPGDEIVQMAGVRTEGGAMAGSNNAAWASGAIEQWRMYDIRASR